MLPNRSSRFFLLVVAILVSWFAATFLFPNDGDSKPPLSPARAIERRARAVLSSRQHGRQLKKNRTFPESEPLCRVSKPVWRSCRHERDCGSVAATSECLGSDLSKCCLCNQLPEF